MFGLLPLIPIILDFSTTKSGRSVKGDCWVEKVLFWLFTVWCFSALVHSLIFEASRCVWILPEISQLSTCISLWTRAAGARLHEWNASYLWVMYLSVLTDVLVPTIFDWEDLAPRISLCVNTVVLCACLRGADSVCGLCVCLCGFRLGVVLWEEAADSSADVCSWSLR